MLGFEVYIRVILLLFSFSEAGSQDSEARIFWATSHDGWSQVETGAWFHADVFESDSVPPNSKRNYALAWSTGSASLTENSNGYHAYGEGNFSGEAELISAWPVTIPYYFLADGELQGGAPALQASDFSNVLPRIINPERLNEITPGDLVAITTTPWSAASTNSRTTWLACYRRSTGQQVWAPSSGGSEGITRHFDTAGLLSSTEYSLLVTYSSRFRGSFVGPTLGNTAQESGFDRVTAYHFTTLGAPCVADLSGDGQLDFFDVSGFLTYFQLGDMNADMNNDEVLNFFDVSTFLSAFASGCP